jgi:16S rRNA (adenine1518-N6/adenine1519-N6)-dimethyltransferase
MTLPDLNVPSLLKKHGITPKKSLGQNFLVDGSILRDIVNSAEVTAESAVLEIGAGLGSLTRVLANTCRRVIAVEIDSRLLPILQEVTSPFHNVEIVAGDMLKLNPADLLSNEQGYAVVANIPYYITSALIRHLLEAPVQPNRLVLTVQREVADRICAAPGDLSLLALSVQVYGTPRIVLRIPASAFYPSPDVDSAVLRVDLHPQPLIPPADMDTFFKLARAGFSQKRKTLRNALSGGLGWAPDRTTAMLTQAGIDPQRRAETLRLDEWAQLTIHYYLEATHNERTGY